MKVDMTKTEIILTFEEARDLQYIIGKLTRSIAYNFNMSQDRFVGAVRFHNRMQERFGLAPAREGM